MSKGQKNKKIGFIGLGKMGSQMCSILLKARYQLKVYDILPERMTLLKEQGAVIAESGAELVSSCDIVMTSLPMPETFVQVAEQTLLPNARVGQLFLDMGTSTPHDTKRIASLLKEKGANCLDTPVSGQPSSGKMRIFVGGDKDVFDAYEDFLHVLGDPQYVVHCGPNGSGQIVKGVNQMAMGLVNAAFIETIAYGKLSGIDPAILNKAIGGSEGFRGQFSQLADKFLKGTEKEIPVKIGQMHIFLEQAKRQGFELPLAKALQQFCENGEKIVDDANRRSQSFWHELALKSENK